MRQTPLLTVVIVWLCLTAQTATAQVGPTSLQAQAEAALVADNPAQAATLARAILADAPDNYPALFVLAVAQTDLGDNRAAARTAAAAYRAAPDRNGRYQAARLAARAHRQLDRFVRAEFWLRRAANNIATKEEAEAIVREYIATTRENPMSVQINGSIAPSDNVNRGSDEGILEFEGIPLTFLLPENQRALSGIEYAASVQMSYRLSQSANQRTSLTAAAAGQTYTLSDEARDLLASSPSESVRGVTGDDFSTALLQLGLTHQRNDLTTFGPVGYGVNFGTYWQSGERTVDFIDLILSQGFVIDADSAVTLRYNLRDQRVRSTALIDTLNQDLSVTYSTAMPNRDQLEVSLTRRKTDAGPETSYTEYRTRLGYDFGQRVFGTRWGTSLELGYRDYPEYLTTLDGRRDTTFSIGTTTVFEDFNYFGFSPSLEAFATRTRSNAEEVNSTALQIRFGIVSNF